MGAEIISLLQMEIWFIVAIMIGMVALYFYLMRLHNKNIYTSNNDKFNQKYNNNQYDESLNSQQNDNGPIQNL